MMMMMMMISPNALGGGAYVLPDLGLALPSLSLSMVMVVDLHPLPLLLPLLLPILPGGGPWRYLAS
ncbi:hypothetical protein GGR50DRAFT_656180 [Xylaria sp. CBS 124048]|nr:hypothetical protein GGR50DRAFT_656180 [Xylaria sp. CBS 124048]